jgi:LuxR family maltose regulon positive regulatory protein
VQSNNFFETHALLASKLRCPVTLDNSLLRPQLTRRLEQGYENSLTLVQAPAGFGKTSTIAQWFQRIKGPKGWFAIDELDNDFPKFMSYAYALIKPETDDVSGSALFNDWSKITPSNSDQIISFFCQHLATYTTRPVLVLDDFHLLTNEALIQCIERLLKNLENHAHIVLLTRTQVSLELNNLLLTDQVNFIHANDLKFNEQETRQFFQSHSDLSYQALRPIVDEFSGWPAGLQLYRLARKNKLTLSQEQSQLGDYILNEIIRHMPEPYLSTVLKAAVSRRFNETLLNELAPDVEVQSVISELETRYSFITMTGNNDRWYHFHSLFRQALIEYYRRTDLTSYQNCEQRCANWWLKQSYYSEAAEHLINADNETAVTQFLIRHAWSFYRGGQYLLLANCFKHIPNANIALHPTLTLTFAWLSLINEDPCQADRLINESERAQVLNASDGASYAAVRAAIAVIYDDFFAAEQWAQLALNSDDQARPWEQCYAYLSIAESRINQCDFAGADISLLAANDICQREKYVTLYIQVLYLQAEIHTSKAHWRKAQDVLATALRYARERGLSKLFSIDHLQRAYARVLRLQGASTETHEILQSMDISSRPLGDYWQFPILVEQLFSLLIDGQHDRANLELLSKRIHCLALEYQFSVKWQLPADRALILFWTVTQDIKQLNYLIQRYQPMLFQTPRFSLNARVNLGLALLAIGKKDEAGSVFQECYHSASLVNYHELKTFCAVGLTIISAEADAPEVHSIFGAFLLKSLLIIFQDKGVVCKPKEIAPPKSLLLTKTERNVQALLQQGLTNRAVAQSLGIAIATVRSHIKSINRKQRQDPSSVEVAMSLK